MLVFRHGDIFSDGAEAIVNTVNCVGVMGRGIALQFKNRYPDNFFAYAAACRDGRVNPGKMFVFPTGRAANPRYVINFPTKRHWRGKSVIADIRAGLRDLVTVIHDKHIRSIALPPLGCGLGGLDWGMVKKTIVEALAPLEEVEVRVYEPGFVATTVNADAPRMTLCNASLLSLARRYLLALLDPGITLLEIQKLLYFLQAAGEPLGLRFCKHHYGPFAPELRHVLQRLEGHFISGYGDGGDAPGKQISLMPNAAEEAEVFLRACPQTLARMERVGELVEGFESPFGLELLATVHWVATAGRACGMAEVVSGVHGWSPRKCKTFTERQIGIAFDRLTGLSWIGD